jgi:hypothetical protein
MSELDPCVLHVAAVADEVALETLCRTTPVIAAAGISQVVLAIDDSDGDRRGSDLTWSTWSAALAAEVRPLRCPGLSIVGKMRALQVELLALFHEKALYAVHLHGLGPCLLGSRALRGSLVQTRVVCSPHGRYFASPWGATLLGHLLQKQLSTLNYVALAASLTEAQTLSKVLNRSADLLPHPVSDVFFTAPRQEDPRPCILADGFGAEAVNRVTRLCVLLNGRDARVRFSWLGAADGALCVALEAASVDVLGAMDDAERAQSLSRASAFIHISAEDFPRAAMQAMAAGVPCLLSDTPAHRALIRHGDTGFICTSERDFLEKLVLLLRDRTERRRIGEAARAEAERCFTARQFERAILRAYGFSRREKAPEQPALQVMANEERKVWNQLGN